MTPGIIATGGTRSYRARTDTGTAAVLTSVGDAAKRGTYRGGRIDQVGVRQALLADVRVAFNGSGTGHRCQDHRDQDQQADDGQRIEDA